MTRTDEIKLPPRESIPPDVTVPSIPWIGTTWYERGLPYWMRRVAMVIFALLILAAWTAMIGTFVRSSGPAGSPAFIGVLSAEIVFSIFSGAWLFNRMWRHTSQAWVTGHRPSRGAGATAATAGIFARAGSVIATAFLGIGVLLTYGLFLAAFITALAPVLPTERDARRLLAEKLQKGHHRIAPPVPSGGHPGSKHQARRDRKRLPRGGSGVVEFVGRFDQEVGAPLRGQRLLR